MRNAFTSLRAKFRTLSPVRHGLIVILAIIAGLLVFAGMTPPSKKRAGLPAPADQSAESESHELQMEAGRAKEELKEYAKMSPAPLDSRDFPGGRVGGIIVPGDPLIAHTAELAVATKEFIKARSSLEEILERHPGLCGQTPDGGEASREHAYGDVTHSLFRIWPSVKRVENSWPSRAGGGSCR